MKKIDTPQPQGFQSDEPPSAALASSTYPSPVALVVSRGPDEGARLELDGQHRTVGRSREADLPLTDLAVSRRHLVVSLVAQGVHVAALPETAPFVVENERVREAVVPFDSAITVGTTVLSVTRQAGRAIVLSSVERTDASTLLQGPAVEIYGMVALASLISWLNEANDTSAIRTTAARWAKLHADADASFLHIEDAAEDAEVCEAYKQCPDDVAKRQMGSAVEITVPAHAQGRAWLTFRFEQGGEPISEAQLRLMLVAGRVVGASLARVHSVHVAEALMREDRRAAIGSARGFLGTSPAAIKLAELIPRVAASSVNVLLLGETGAGKTFAARLLHEASPRAREPFRVINCASIPEPLLESELFGHERGAFTGASSAREGAFEYAGRGTLFLDEIGELSLSSQAKLLRVLEDRKFERLGSNRSTELRARLVVATNRDLTEMVRRGTFRSDLLFRLSVVSLRIPPLRERGEDLILLAEHILADLAPTADRRIDGFAPDAIAALRSYPWYGNVRELRNAIEHAIVLGDERLIHARDLPQPLAALPPSGSEIRAADGPIIVTLPLPIAQLEELDIEAALKASGGNRTKAAALLGINRATLYNKLRAAAAVASDETGSTTPRPAGDLE